MLLKLLPEVIQPLIKILVRKTLKLITILLVEMMPIVLYTAKMLLVRMISEIQPKIFLMSSHMQRLW